MLHRGASLDRPRIQHEDVDRRGLGGDLLREHAHRPSVGEVAPLRSEGAPECRDLGRDVVARVERRAHPDDVGTGARQCHRRCPPDASSGPRDEGGLAGEVERPRAHARQSTRTFIAADPSACSSKRAGRRSSGSTAVISLSSGRRSVAIRSIDRS